MSKEFMSEEAYDGVYQQDPIDEGLRRDIDRINDMMQRTQLIATEVIMHQEKYGHRPLPRNIDESLEEINDELDTVSHLDVMFSGDGCIPAIMPNGENVTIYGKAESMKGQLGTFYLSDAKAMEYIEAEDIDDVIEDEAGVMLMKDDYELIKKQMINPEFGLRLFTEFFLESDYEVLVSGSSRRAPEVDNYAIMDSARLRIDSVEVEDEFEPCSEDDLPECLVRSANDMRKLFEDTKFRRMSSVDQIGAMDSAIARLNKELQIDRFKAIFWPDDLYVPDTSNENHRMKNIDASSLPGQVLVDCLRIDSLESLYLTNGLYRIAKTSRMRDGSVAYCIVGQIDVHTKSMLGLESDIVWIPVRPFPKPRRNRGLLSVPSIYDATFIYDDEM